MRHGPDPASPAGRALLLALAHDHAPNTLAWAITFGGKSPNTMFRRVVLSLYRPGHFIMVLRSLGFEKEAIEEVGSCRYRCYARIGYLNNYHLSKNFCRLCEARCYQCTPNLRELLRSKKFTLADLRLSGGVNPDAIGVLS